MRLRRTSACAARNARPRQRRGTQRQFGGASSAIGREVVRFVRDMALLDGYSGVKVPLAPIRRRP
jgi:hypothetical protein